MVCKWTANAVNVDRGGLTHIVSSTCKLYMQTCKTAKFLFQMRYKDK